VKPSDAWKPSYRERICLQWLNRGYTDWIAVFFLPNSINFAPHRAWHAVQSIEKLCKGLLLLLDVQGLGQIQTEEDAYPVFKKLGSKSFGHNIRAMIHKLEKGSGYLLTPIVARLRHHIGEEKAISGKKMLKMMSRGEFFEVRYPAVSPIYRRYQIKAGIYADIIHSSFPVEVASVLFRAFMAIFREADDRMFAYLTQPQPREFSARDWQRFQNLYLRDLQLPDRVDATE